MKAKEKRWVCLFVCIAVICLALIGGLIYLIAANILRHEVCSIDVGEDTVTVYRIGWASGSGEAKFQVMLNRTPILEYECTGEFMTTPSAAISLSGDDVLIKSVGGDGYEIVLQLQLADDKQSVTWYYADWESRLISKTDAEGRYPPSVDNVKALAPSVELSYRE